MKNIYSALVLIAFIFLSVASSVQNNFYQVYETVPENGKLSNNEVVFEDDNCTISYNLWENRGDIGFDIYNKTNDNLILHKDKSFFILNNYAYDYFLNRITSNSSSNSITSSSSYSNQNKYLYNNRFTSSSGSSQSSFSSNATAYNEKDQIIIPPKTNKRISEYSIVNSFYSTCDALKFPAIRKIKKLSFDKNNSPFVFYNLIAYETNGKITQTENKFYVSSITNMPESEMVISVNKDKCDDIDSQYNSYSNKIFVFKDNYPNRFYYMYNKKYDSEKH
jgi:hypothetical protein